MRAHAFWVGLLGLALLRCSSAAAEGEACDLAQGNADCQSGLVCVSPLDVKADHAICCPAPGDTPNEAGCHPATEGAMPDAGVGPQYSSGGSLNDGGASGGSAGVGGSSAGAAGNGGAAGAGGSSGGSSGAAGSSGTGGVGGTTGGAPGTGGSAGSGGTTGGSAGSN